MAVAFDDSKHAGGQWVLFMLLLVVLVWYEHVRG